MKLGAHEEPGEGLRAALRRLAAQAWRDVERFHENPESRLHSLRRTMKRYRSLLGLARQAGVRSKRRKLAELARTLKNRLSGARDALVARETVESVLGRPALSRTPSAPPRTVPENLRQAADDLVERTGRLDLSKLDRSVLKKAWKRTKRRLGRARRNAAEWGDAEDFHRWRKRAKDAWYQSDFLRGVFKSAARLRKFAESLSEVLGREHDVTVALGVATGLDKSGRAALEEHRRILRKDALSRDSQARSCRGARSSLCG